MSDDDYVMKAEYDFSNGKRGAVFPTAGKTRTTIMFDNDVLDYFRARSNREGLGYQTMINAALRESIAREKKAAASKTEDDELVTVGALKKILRDALKR